jgi:hypothetical protein
MINTTVSQFGYLGSEIFGNPLLIGLVLFGFIIIIALRNRGGIPLVILLTLPLLFIIGGVLIPAPLYIIILMILAGIIGFGLLSLYK